MSYTVKYLDKNTNNKLYDSEIRNIYHDLGYWIINLCYWYPDTKYTKEQAIETFKNKDK